MVSRMEAQLTPRHLAALANSVDTEAVRALFRLIATTGYPDARLARALKREFLAAVVRWRKD
jgi:transcriptional regulator, MerR family